MPNNNAYTKLRRARKHMFILMRQRAGGTKLFGFVHIGEMLRMNIRFCVYTRFSMQGKCGCYNSYVRGNKCHRRLSLRLGSFGSYLAFYYVCLIKCPNSSPSMLTHMSPNHLCFYLSYMNVYNNV